jgi:hypothetical protein
MNLDLNEDDEEKKQSGVSSPPRRRRREIHIQATEKALVAIVLIIGVAIGLYYGLKCEIVRR